MLGQGETGRQAAFPQRSTVFSPEQELRFQIGAALRKNRSRHHVSFRQILPIT